MHAIFGQCAMGCKTLGKSSPVLQGQEEDMVEDCHDACLLVWGSGLK